jgi:hypothetical protein
MPTTLPSALASARPTAATVPSSSTTADAIVAMSSAAKPSPTKKAATRWPRSVSMSESLESTPTEHEDEQEQHEDRAGVDDHLGGGQERRVLGGVEAGQRQHHRGQEQRRVHGVAAEHHHDRRDRGERAEHPEGDRLAGARAGAATPAPARRPAAGRSPVHLAEPPVPRACSGASRPSTAGSPPTGRGGVADPR